MTNRRQAIRREKIKISLPHAVLVAVDGLSKRSDSTRGAVIGPAVVAYLAADYRSATPQRYPDAYRRRPESRTEQGAALALAMEALATGDWNV
jgi:hypothetical protein